jgi:ABC-type spermidine/putrescine transport system permease subunit I
MSRFGRAVVTTLRVAVFVELCCMTVGIPPAQMIEDMRPVVRHPFTWGEHRDTPNAR